MHKKRKLLPLFLVFFWVLLFALGLSQVFLYLQGYTPFSLFKEREIQRGYATFSSSHFLFLNGKYLGNGDASGRYELGKYSLCVESLGYRSRCFNDIEVKSNDFPSVKMKDIILLHKNILDKAIFWTKEKIFYTSDFSFFWYEPLKKQIFFVDSVTDGVQSYFPQYDVDSIEYDEKMKTYFLLGHDENGAEKRMDIPFSSEIFTFLQKGDNEEKYIYNDYGILKKDFSSSFSQEKEQLVLLFDVKADRFIPFYGGSIVIFKDSVYFFSEQEEELFFICVKDENTPVVFLRNSGNMFFIQNKSLYSISLL